MMATEAPGLRVSCTIWRFCSIDRNCRRRTPVLRTSLITLLCTLFVSTPTPHVDTTKCPLPSWAHHVSVWFSGGGGPDTTLTHFPVLDPIMIQTWRREYNEERHKRVLDGLTPAEYAPKTLDRIATR